MSPRLCAAAVMGLSFALLCSCAAPPSRMAPVPQQPAPDTALPDDIPQPQLLQLGAGDAVRLQVAGRPELDATLYVSDDGDLDVPMIGQVHAGGLAPAEAARAIAAAYRSRDLLVDPQVTLVLDRYQSQRISVLGQVRSPGRLPLQSHTTVFDALAEAGGMTDDAADTVYVMRAGSDGKVGRIAVPLRSGAGAASAPLELALRGGDAIFVPPAERFYIYGEVNTANMYRLEPGMTVRQAISRGGGLTVRGSGRRVEITRKSADGRIATIDAGPDMRVQSGDVIRVKERLF